MTYDPPLAQKPPSVTMTSRMPVKALKRHAVTPAAPRAVSSGAMRCRAVT
jgi:hypothetical protein